MGAAFPISGSRLLEGRDRNLRGKVKTRRGLEESKSQRITRLRVPCELKTEREMRSKKRKEQVDKQGLVNSEAEPYAKEG